MHATGEEYTAPNQLFCKHVQSNRRRSQTNPMGKTFKLSEPAKDLIPQLPQRLGIIRNFSKSVSGGLAAQKLGDRFFFVFFYPFEILEGLI